MKKRHLPLFFTALLGSFIYLACQKTETPDIEKPGKGHIVETVDAQISGRVIDDQKLPVSGATVKVGTSILTTDINGEFKFSKVQVDKTAALVLIEKAGFFQGIKTLIVETGKEHQVVIQLIRKTTTGTITGSAGGTITLPDGGGSIVFEPNSMMNPANKAGYSGAVSVSAFFINPTAENFQEIMPGTLRGVDANNNVTGLQSYGMMAVELSGANGEKLQLAGGRKATLRFPIPTSLQGEAPTTIPLWSLNDTTGLWREEGIATKQGNEYVGTVGHFSFWNCDVPYQFVEFSATIRDQQNAPVAYTKVIITTNNGTANVSGSGNTNAEGVVGGFIPARQPLKIKIVDKCGRELHNQDIGPFTAKANLGNISITTSYTAVTFSGTAATCNGTPVIDGVADIILDEQNYRAKITNGNFSITILRCNATAAEARITVFDVTNNKGSAVKTVTVTNTAVALGQLMACGDMPNEYILYIFNGASHLFKAPENILAVGFYPTPSETPTHTRITTKPKEGTSGPSTLLWIAGASAGVHRSAGWNFTEEATNTHYWLNEQVDITVSRYEKNAGGYIEGQFEGNAIDTSKGPGLKPLTGTFRIKYPQ
ncbi:hypothetical protein [Paraflavitalea sp. CAU 1676]|uniref:hypothetical protein n=1 Tax=Paraflavitalea sp. CAU 1676 TaxID=3032598 RepID=UPI0023DBA98F|nr:hypothetical protein [Paraflavitalea sp. CAU 1676]MDF2187809.1 hypothetical protein [Paraflavitalea sp. CAU 1676]